MKNLGQFLEAKLDTRNFCLVIAYNDAYNEIKDNFGDIEIFCNSGGPNGFVIPKDDAAYYKKQFGDDVKTYEIPKKYKAIDDFEEDYATGELSLNDDLKVIEEGWTGNKGDKAFDEILDAWEMMEKKDILNMIWTYFSVDDLENLYKWMKQDGYFD